MPSPSTVPAPLAAVAASSRAPRMSPEERREMLIEATWPLIAEHGLKVTTRHIAEAAGVAEGTIFRVFPDKEALIRATVNRILDPGPTLAELAAVDPGLPLRLRLMTVTGILQRRFLRVFNLMIAIGMHGPPEDVAKHKATARAPYQSILDEICRILEPDADRLRLPVPEAVRVLRMLAFSGTHPMINDGQLMSAGEITDVLLDGILQRGETTRKNEGEHRC